MRIVYLGSGEFGLACLDALVQSGLRLQFIVTQPARPAGRGRVPTLTPVAQWATNKAIPFLETSDANSTSVLKKVAACEPDLIVVIAFGQKIGTELTKLPAKGAINVHASLLPKYRGAAPINWAIIKGETETGVSIITLAEKMDAGKILAQEKTKILPDETAGELHDRLAKIAVPLLLETIERIGDGTAIYTEQDPSQAILAPKLKKNDGYLDFNEPAEVLARKIRGLTPWPGALAAYLSKKTQKTVHVTITRAETVVQEQPELRPGVLDENLRVTCGTGALNLIEIKPAGSRSMDFKDFINGQQTQAGDMFVKIKET